MARYLRGLRAAAGLTYDELAKEAWFSPASLKRAARGGARVPRWETVRAYAHACHGSPEEARARYERAEAAAAAAARDARRSTLVPKPQFVRDLADLSGALRDAYRRAGRPPVRQMARQAGPDLPGSTAHAIITAHALPRDVRTYIAFLEACEITGPALVPWFEAWVKVRGVGAGVRPARAAAGADGAAGADRAASAARAAEAPSPSPSRFPSQFPFPSGAGAGPDLRSGVRLFSQWLLAGRHAPGKSAAPAAPRAAPEVSRASRAAGERDVIGGRRRIGPLGPAAGGGAGIAA
nr:helix-turn-helix transcriptional regulator [Streptomyces typhae]